MSVLHYCPYCPVVKQHWKSILLLAVCLLCLLLTGLWLSDPHCKQLGAEKRLLLLCLAQIPLLSVFITALRSRNSLRPYLSLLLLAGLWIVVDPINFSGFNKRFFLSSVHHTLVTMECLLLIRLAAKAFLPAKASTLITRILFIPLEIILWILPLGLILNRIVCGYGVEPPQIIAICQTHPREAWDFFFQDNHGALILCLIIPVIAAIIWALWRLNRPVPEAPRNRVLLPGFAVCVIALVTATSLLNVLRYTPPHFYQLFQSPFLYYQQIITYDQARERRHQLLETLKLPTTKQGHDGIFVLIIGESLNRNHMGAYGYAKNTTPHQSKMRTLPNAFFFDNPHSSHVLTVLTVPMMITDQNQYASTAPDDQDKATCSILDLANACGYHTIWLSNQERISRFASLISALADSAKMTSYEKLLYRHASPCDGILLKRLQKLGKLPPRTLLVLHLAGSHRPYSARVPLDFTCPPELTDPYDQSVYYNDYVISQIISLLERQNLAAVFYSSDHSENLQHGHNPAFFTPELTEIPVWTYLAPDYAKDHPELVKALRDATHRPFTNDLLFNLMLDVMNLKPDFVNPRFSPLAPDYILLSQPPKTLHGKLNLDH